MSLLPDIDDDGKIKEVPELGLFKAPRYYHKQSEEERLTEINNLGRLEVPEDFSDSPHLNR